MSGVSLNTAHDFTMTGTNTFNGPSLSATTSTALDLALSATEVTDVDLSIVSTNSGTGAASISLITDDVISMTTDARIDIHNTQLAKTTTQAHGDTQTYTTVLEGQGQGTVAFNLFTATSDNSVVVVTTTVLGFVPTAPDPATTSCIKTVATYLCTSGTLSLLPGGPDTLTFGDTLVGCTLDSTSNQINLTCTANATLSVDTHFRVHATVQQLAGAVFYY